MEGWLWVNFLRCLWSCIQHLHTGSAVSASWTWIAGSRVDARPDTRADSATSAPGATWETRLCPETPADQVGQGSLPQCMEVPYFPVSSRPVWDVFRPKPSGSTYADHICVKALCGSLFGYSGTSLKEWPHCKNEILPADCNREVPLRYKVDTKSVRYIDIDFEQCRNIASVMSDFKVLRRSQHVWRYHPSWDPVKLATNATSLSS